MSRTLIKIVDISESGNIEITFIRQLHHSGLIEIIEQNKTEFIDEDTLPRLEQYYTWYDELELNIEGIEVAQRLLDKIQRLQEEIRLLKS